MALKKTLLSRRFALNVVALACLLVAAATAPVITLAQARPQPHDENVPEQKGTSGSQPEPSEDKNFPEAEFVASSKFRSFSYLQPLAKDLNFEGHYFGVEDVDVGALNASWTFRLGKSVKLSPGVGVYFGEHQRTGPAFTFRWEVEKGPIISQGLLIQGFRKVKVEEAAAEEENSVYPNIWDGNHVSLRYRRLEIGPTWERIHSREGNEWKGGGRVAVDIFPHVTAVMFVMAPETEVRGGIIIHPSRHKE